MRETQIQKGTETADQTRRADWIAENEGRGDGGSAVPEGLPCPTRAGASCTAISTASSYVTG